MKNLLKYSLLLSFLLILKYPQAQETYSLPNFSFENWSTAPGDTLSVMGGMLTLPLYNAYQYPASWDYITYHINRSVSLGFQNIQVNTTLPLLKAAYETGSFVPHGNKALTLQTFKLSDIIPPSTYNMVSSYIDTFYTNMIFPSVLTTAAIDADHFLTLFTDMLDSVNTFNANQVIAAFSQSDMNDYFSGGLALNGFEPTRLHGYYKYTSAGTGNDNGGIMLIGTHYNTATGMREVVGGGFNRNFTDTDFYQPFDVVYSALPFADSVNTTPSADSLIILIISSANNNRQYGSLFYLDSLILYHDSIPRPDTCHAIQNLHLLTKDTFNITVAWTDSSAMCWQMEYGEHGYVLGSDTCYITTDTMLVLTRLTPASLVDGADASHSCRNEDGRIHLPFAVGRCAEHDVAASGYLCRRSQHQHGAEKRRRTARDVETHLLNGDRLLPAHHTRSSLHLLALKLLRGMKLLDIGMSKLQGIL